MDIAVQTKVECADGPCGECSTVIVDPHKQAVTHLVVQDKTLSDTDQRLVPFDRVQEASREQIRLRCTRKELAAMEPFVETRYVVTQEQPIPTYPIDGQMHMVGRPDAAGSYYEEEEVELIPEGEQALRPGMKVKATDGQIGHVAELVVEPESGKISHLVLEKGHLWGKKEVTVPLSEVNFADEDTVHLKLDKEAVRELPAVPVKRHRA
jgi:sporulation protein YlmC with PRC-barrel domain